MNDIGHVQEIESSPDGLNKETFLKRKKDLEPRWQEVIVTIPECIRAVDNSDSDLEDVIEDITNGLNLIEMKWENFFSLEAEIEKEIITLSEKMLMHL